MIPVRIGRVVQLVASGKGEGREKGAKEKLFSGKFI